MTLEQSANKAGSKTCGGNAATDSKSSTETGHPLNEKQLENWRNLFPHLRLMPDEAVERFRNAIQNRFTEQ